MSNTGNFAKKELGILVKSSTDPGNRPLIEEFIPEIIALVDKFGESGQSGGSAPFTAEALSHAIKQLCLFRPISPVMGTEDEWNDTVGGLFQNKRCSALFMDGLKGKAYYLNAIVWKGEREHDTFTGTVENVRSRQQVKAFPFEPKTFYIDVVREPYDKEKHNVSDSVSCGDGDYCCFIKDREQLKEVFEYYDLYQDNLKA